MANPFPFASGDVLTAAELNDIGAWTSFTPSFVSGVTVGNATIEAAYITLNQITFVYVDFILGSTSAITGDVRLSLPVNALGATVGTFTVAAFLQGNAYDFSASGYYKLMGRAFDNSSVRITASAANTTYVQYASLGSTAPFTWTTNDHLTFSTYYRSA